MHARLRLSLRTRITLVAAVVVAALLWAGGLYLRRDTRAALRRSLDAQVAAVARDVAGQLQGGAEPGAVVLRGGGPFPLPLVQVRDAGGALVATIGPGVTLEFGRPHPLRRGDVEPAVPVGPAPPAPPRPPAPVTPLPALLRDPGWSVTGVPVERVGTDLAVYAGSPYSVVGAVVEPLEDRLRLAVPLAGLVAAALAYLLARRALRPVDAIRAEAEAVTEASLSRRVPEPAVDDEVGRLARTFNLMLGRLEAAQARQRQFVSDASHELRSPVTVLRSSLEVAAAHPEATDRRAMVADLLVVTGRLERLVDDLLLLARQGETGAPAAAEEVDLDEVVRAEVSLRGPARVALAGVEPARVRGSRRDLARVAANLVDNALRWADSTVEVSLRREGGAAVLHVDDDGPGVPEADRRRVFERFVRLDGARARSDGGAGLGLAVVAETAAAHGGSAEATTSPLGGARFTVRLPAAEG